MFRPARTSVAALALALPAVAVGIIGALASPVHAATSYTVQGAGFGHGVGMSQYGALGMAKQGNDHRRILAHYYPGAQLGAAPSDRIRVLLAEGAPSVEFTGAARVPGARSLDPDRTYRATARPDGKVELRTSAGKLVDRYRAPLVVDGRRRPVRLVGRALNGVSDGAYRGALSIYPAPGGLSAVNVVGLEKYLRGVVPGEMPASWASEALKSQAVAARSYALATARRRGIFDQYPDMRSQVYKGVSGERRESDAAVSATAGKVLLSDGAVATTFFYSSSGGRTESNANVFGGRPLPYLRSVRDRYDRVSPYHRWAVTFTASELEHRLGSLVDGHYRGIDVLERGDSPRILKAEVVGTRGRRATTGATLRARLGLRDTWAYFGSIDTTVATAASAPRSPAMGPAPVGVLRGKVAPAPAHGRIAVQRKGRRGWRTAARAVTDPNGAYRVAVDRPGRYRIVAGDAGGPAVRVGR